MKTDENEEAVVTNEEKNAVNAFKMLGVILEARLGKKVTVGFPGMDGAPLFGDALFDEPIEDDFPEDEVHIFVTHTDDIFGMCGDLTIAESLKYTRLAEAVVELSSVRLPPAYVSIPCKDGYEFDRGEGAVIWMLSAETADNIFGRKTLIAHATERAFPGMHAGFAGGPTGAGFQQAKDYLIELLVNRRVVDGVSCMIDLNDTGNTYLDYRNCKNLAI